MRIRILDIERIATELAARRGKTPQAQFAATVGLDQGKISKLENKKLTARGIPHHVVLTIEALIGYIPYLPLDTQEEAQQRAATAPAIDSPDLARIISKLRAYWHGLPNLENHDLYVLITTGLESALDNGLARIAQQASIAKLHAPDTPDPPPREDDVGRGQRTAPRSQSPTVAPLRGKGPRKRHSR